MGGQKNIFGGGDGACLGDQQGVAEDDRIKTKLNHIPDLSLSKESSLPKGPGPLLVVKKL